MSREAVLLLCVNFLLIALLPRIFFRKGGKLGLQWWATALPLFIAPVTAVLVFLHQLTPIEVSEQVRGIMALVSVALSAASIALIGLTLGTNRIPLSLWHQKDDAPHNIVTFGAYRLIRHPFYSSFLLAVLSALLLAPHFVTLLTLIYAFVALNITAAREEKRLATSEFGEEYREYLKRTGRFLPRFPGRRGRIDG